MSSWKSSSTSEPPWPQRRPCRKKKEAVANSNLETAALRDELKANQAKFEVELRRASEFAESQHLEEIRTLKAREASTADERDVLKAHLTLLQSVAPPWQELDVPAHGRHPAAKHVRISCPGIEVDQIDIDKLSDGVSVKIRADTNELAETVFERSFQYSDRDGFFELCLDECGVDNGVLILVLKRVQRPKLKLATVKHRSPLIRIDEHEAPTHADTDVPQVFSLSPSPSLGTLTTVSSEWVVASSAPSEHGFVQPSGSTGQPVSNAPVDEEKKKEDKGQVNRLIFSAPSSLIRQRCLLPDSLVMAADGSAIRVSDLRQGMQLCALCKGDSKELMFGFASVLAIRVGTLRDSDIAQITLQDEPSLKFSVTTSHNVLATTGGEE
eukprot:gnl/TRDRNA2_/TRDRNA2_181231_c0_seq1.p1 gnl/TRDRNA2_/TRDRNA2_181231_c0~~gnl/TRDRNA2_/TRDRNA2_181231_c0_seq1.p1  ORF type:complete len:383 (+),score=76.47 gnl/TRDRNA2_/TRDRNA2_181231_c0_seq1:468-1616(+)